MTSPQLRPPTQGHAVSPRRGPRGPRLALGLALAPGPFPWRLSCPFPAALRGTSAGLAQDGRPRRPGAGAPRESPAPGRPAASSLAPAPAAGYLSEHLSRGPAALDSETDTYLVWRQMVTERLRSFNVIALSTYYLLIGLLCAK